MASARRLPFETIVVPGRDALEARAKLLERADVTPIVMGSAEDIQLLCDLLADSKQSVEAIVAAGAAMDVDAWFDTLAKTEGGYYSVKPGTWPEGGASQPGLTVHLDIRSRQPKAEVIIGLVPADEAWQVPAHLRYGDWNDCPSPAVHVAVHKRWSDRYGSRIACASGDVIECTVARPPASRDEALALAREQFLYAPDIVHQGAETIEELAATLLDGRTWYFWWD